MGPVRQNPIQRTVRTAHLSVLMTVHSFSTQHNTEQFWWSLLLPPDKHQQHTTKTEKTKYNRKLEHSSKELTRTQLLLTWPRDLAWDGRLYKDINYQHIFSTKFFTFQAVSITSFPIKDKKHRRNQGVQWVHLHLRAVKNRRNLQGKFVSAPQHTKWTPGRVTFNFVGHFCWTGEIWQVS